MKIGKVIGQVWADKKVDSLKGVPLFVVQPVDDKNLKCGKTLVVADPQQLAGLHDRIIYVTSTDATQAFDSGFAPVNASVVELVDSIE